MARRKMYPGQVEPRGGRFRIRLSVAGKRHTKSIIAESRAAAERYATEWAEKLERAAARESSGQPGAITFGELVELFREQVMPGLSEGGRSSYENSFTAFEPFFATLKGDPALERVRPGTIREFLAWRRVHRVRTKGEGETRVVVAVQGRVSAHTVARDYRVLKRLFRYAVKTEYLVGDPVAAVEAPRTDPRTPRLLTPDEFTQLLDACTDPMLHLYVTLLADTGARAYSEALRLRWEDIDLAGGFLEIRSGRDGHRTKSGKSRWAPLTARLAAELREHAATYRLALYHGQRTPWVFHHTQTSRRARAGERIRSFQDRFRTALKGAGLAPIRMHDLRHRRVTTWLAEGKPAALVQEAMGHATITTTMGYSHLAREHLRALVDEPESTRRKRGKRA